MAENRTVGGGEEDGSTARVVNSDIGFEAGAATRLFNDVRRGVDRQDVNPSETNAGWVAGVVEPLLTDEMRRKNVDGLRGRVFQKIVGFQKCSISDMRR